MVLTIIAASLALLSFGLNVWQWLAARRFPVHQRVNDRDFAPDVTLLKPLKGCDAETEQCLRSWFEQEYHGPVQLLFGVASEQDPVCGLVRRLIAEYSDANAELVICPEQLGPNAKVTTLVCLQSRARHDVLVISDADVWAPSDLLINVVAPLRRPDVGLVNCFYQLGNPSTLAMRWESVSISADFWSQVLQAQTIKPLDFALGAVMSTRLSTLDKIGGFSVLCEYLADDYQLGSKIARLGLRIILCPVVVECRSEPMGWGAVWTHQLRWARTIRACQPGPFFLSVLGNATLWPLVWLAIDRTPVALVSAFVFWSARVLEARSNQRRFTGRDTGWEVGMLALLKDILSVAVWVAAFIGNEVLWRGQRYRILRDGRLREVERAENARVGV